MAVNFVWTFILFFDVVFVAGSNHNCDSSTQPVVRLCNGTSLVNQSLVYIDFTTFNNYSSTDSCSCIFTPRVNGSFKVQPHVPSYNPGRGCGVPIQMSQVANSYKSVTCFSISNFSFSASTLPLNITIRHDPPTGNRNPDYSCYSAMLENNQGGLFDVVCEDKSMQNNPPSSTFTPSTSPTTSVSLTLPSTTTTSPPSSLQTTSSPLVSSTTTKSSAYTTQIAKQSKPEDVTPWHMIIPAIAAGFIIILAIMIGACVIHYRGRRKDIERAEHNLRVQNGLDMYNAVENHTSNPVYQADDIIADEQNAELQDPHYSSANSMKKSVKWDGQTDPVEKYRFSNGSVNEPAYAVVENLGTPRESQNIDDALDDTATKNEYLYAEVKRDRKLSDVVEDSDSNVVENDLSVSEKPSVVNIEQPPTVTPIYAVPDKRKKQRNNELHKSIISIDSEGSKTEYHKE